MEEDEEITEEQQNIRDKRIANLLPYQYKKGQSGNPSGRPLGISLKEYARLKFRTMTDEEREEFFNGMSKIDLFKMAEGNPKNDVEVAGQLELKVIIPNQVAEAFNIHGDTNTDSETSGSNTEQV